MKKQLSGGQSLSDQLREADLLRIPKVEAKAALGEQSKARRMREEGFLRL